MRLGLRLFLGFFLIVGAGRVASSCACSSNEVKPGVRQAMEDTLVDTANVLAGLASRRPASRAHRRWPVRARRAALARQRDVERRRSGASPSAASTTASTSPMRAASSCSTPTGRDIGRDNSRWNDVYLHPARRVRRAFHPQRSGRRDPHGDARRRADPRWRRPHHRRADAWRKPNQRHRAVHRASQRSDRCAGASC